MAITLASGLSYLHKKIVAGRTKPGLKYRYKKSNNIPFFPSPFFSVPLPPHLPFPFIPPFFFYFFNEGIAHRDLKSSNILVKSDFTLCIADLGLSVKQAEMGEGVDQIPTNKLSGIRQGEA